MTEHGEILSSVELYYANRLAQHGATARGVDWNSESSQRLRFEKLLAVCAESAGEISLLDYGCGYGALVDTLRETGREFRYLGYDIAPAMVDVARQRYGEDARVRFTSEARALERTDFVVASGIFNVRLRTERDAWERYVYETVDQLAALAVRGFAFNVLTGYSDPDRMRPDLYYADPLPLFDHCRRRHSRYVALLHDYPLYEFTMLVKSDAPA